MASIKFGRYHIEHDGVSWMMCHGWKRRRANNRMYPIKAGWYGDLHQVAKALVDAEMVEAAELPLMLREVVELVTLKLKDLEAEVLLEDVKR